MERLNWDPNRNPTSQPLYKKGKNRGRAYPEPSGEWIFVEQVYKNSGATTMAYKFAEALAQIGIRVGWVSSDDCTNYYIFVLEKK